MAAGDDPLHADGRGNEIYAAAFVRRYDRQTSNILEYSSRQTRVYGDSYRSDRIQAGSGGALGGIANRDKIPDGASVERTVPAQEGVFPWNLWEGTLTDGLDALLISPTIWESDGNTSTLAAWSQNQQALNSTLFLAQQVQDQINQKRFAPLTLGTVEGLSGSTATLVGRSIIDTTFSALTGLPALTLIFNGSRDRPIGLVDNGIDSLALRNRAVVLTREIIEAALAGPASGPVPTPTPGVIIIVPKPGIMVIEFFDSWNNREFSNPLSLEGRGSYYMVLQVERTS
jgi:hypothetical protein